MFVTTTDSIPFLEMITEMSFKDLISIIITIIFTVVIIRIIIYNEINKINRELKRLDDKFKIYERLTKTEAKIGI